MNDPMRSLPNLTGTLLLWLGLRIGASNPAIAGQGTAAWTNDVVASFRLEADGQDSAGKCMDAELTRTHFNAGALFLNGAYESGGADGFRAVVAVPGLHYDSLTFGVQVYPLDFEPAQTNDWFRDILDHICRFGNLPVQRRNHSGHDTLLVGGTSYRWLGYRQQDGCLELTLNNQEFVHRYTNIAVSCGRWHSLVGALDLEAGRVRTVLDGRRLDDVELPGDFRLKIVGSPEEAKDREFTFANYSNGSTFHGYATHLRVLGRALAEPELSNFEAATRAETPPEMPPEAASHGARSIRPLLMVSLPLLMAAFGWRHWRRSRNRNARPHPEQSQSPR